MQNVMCRAVSGIMVVRIHTSFQPIGGPLEWIVVQSARVYRRTNSYSAFLRANLEGTNFLNILQRAICESGAVAGVDAPGAPKISPRGVLA